MKGLTIFKEPRPRMNIFEARNKYNNSGIILINIETDELNVVTGDLYAVCDNDEKSLNGFYDLVSSLIGQDIEIAVYDKGLLVEE